MPDYTTYETPELLEVIQQGMLSQPQGEALAELLDRVIKENDSDDIEYQSVYAWRRGLRPLHAPRV